MASSNLLKVLAITAFAGCLAYTFTWIARWLAPRYGFVDIPDGDRKLHNNATPLLGGIAVYAAFVVGAVTFALVVGLRNIQTPELLFGCALLTSGAIFCGIGLWDDMRPLRARNKFLLQVVAATPFVVFGPIVHSVDFMGVGLQLGPLAIPFTIFWIVSCANIVNLIDGLDGLATSVGLIACGTLAALSLLLQQGGIAGVGLIFAACLAGFLIHNWPPAKIFLGDAGSLMIGFIVGALSIGTALKTATGFVLILPIVLLSIPILDTILAILRRKLMGRPIGVADRGHIHHRLQERGLSKLQTLLAIAAICLAMAITVVVAGSLRNDFVALASCLAVIAIVMVGRVFGFYEMALAFRHVQILRTVMRNAVGGIGARLFFMRFENTDESDPNVLWDIAKSHVEGAGGTILELTLHDGQEESTVCRTATWIHDESRVDEEPAWELRYSVPREKGLVATLAASGVSGEDSREQRIEQLVHVFARVCRNWPNMSIADAFIQFRHSEEEDAADAELEDSCRAA